MDSLSKASTLKAQEVDLAETELLKHQVLGPREVKGLVFYGTNSSGIF